MPINTHAHDKLSIIYQDGQKQNEMHIPRERGKTEQNGADGVQKQQQQQ
jgi:hypothetical protein